MNIFQILSGRFFLNYSQGTLRSIYGTMWRIIFDKPKFTSKEYISGPKKRNNYDEMENEFINRIIVFIF